MTKPKKTTTRIKPKTPKKEIPVATTIDLASVSPVDTCIAYKAVAMTQEGQIMVADLMRRFGFSRYSTHVPGDPELSRMNEGSRLVIVHIGRQIDADPAAFEDQEKVEF